MDPDATLADLRRRITDYRHRVDDSLGRIDETDFDPIIELITALDTWLRNGGFVPQAWTRISPSCDSIPADQRWFWTEAWQAGEREASEQIAAGTDRPVYDDMTALLADTEVGPHPITTHLREAAEQIRLANHATHGDTRNAAQLYDTIGELMSLLTRLPQLVTHLAAIIGRAEAEPSRYYDDRRGNVAHTLRHAAIEIDDVRFLLGRCQTHAAEVFSALGHLGTTDTDTDTDTDE